MNGLCIKLGRKRRIRFADYGSVNCYRETGRLQDNRTLSANGGGGCTAMMAVTEDTPPDMLAGNMNLKLTLPNGKKVKMSIERKMAMMDLLVHVTTSQKLSVANHALQPYGNNGLLPYKPNTPIGALDVTMVHIVPKNQLSTVQQSNKVALKQLSQPFDITSRIQVRLPRNQLYVLRARPRMTVGEIHHEICSEKNLDPTKYSLRHPKRPDNWLDEDMTVAEFKHNELILISHREAAVRALSHDDIMSAIGKQRSNNLAVINSATMESSSRSLSPDSSVSPPICVISRSATTNSTAHVNGSAPRHPPYPQRKKKPPAPKPPSQVTSVRSSSDNKREDRNQDESSNTKDNQGKGSGSFTAGNSVFHHSRTSSDSSGYHEPSLISDSPPNSNNSSLPDSLPRLSKLKDSGVVDATTSGGGESRTTIMGRPKAAIGHRLVGGNMSRSLSNLNRIASGTSSSGGTDGVGGVSSSVASSMKPAQSMSSLYHGGRKKRLAPAPPPGAPMVTLKEEIGLPRNSFATVTEERRRSIDLDRRLSMDSDDGEHVSIKQRAEDETERAEAERQRSEMERQRVVEERQRVELERQRAELERQKLQEEKLRDELERQRMEEEHRKEVKRLEAERSKKLLLEMRVKEERLAEERRLEAERLAEERRLEAERLAQERRLEAERLAEEERLLAERIKIDEQRKHIESAFPKESTVSPPDWNGDTAKLSNSTDRNRTPASSPGRGTEEIWNGDTVATVTVTKAMVHAVSGVESTKVLSLSEDEFNQRMPDDEIDRIFSQATKGHGDDEDDSEIVPHLTTPDSPEGGIPDGATDSGHSSDSNNDTGNRHAVDNDTDGWSVEAPPTFRDPPGIVSPPALYKDDLLPPVSATSGRNPSLLPRSESHEPVKTETVQSRPESARTAVISELSSVIAMRSVTLPRRTTPVASVQPVASRLENFTIQPYDSSVRRSNSTLRTVDRPTINASSVASVRRTTSHISPSTRPNYLSAQTNENESSVEAASKEVPETKLCTVNSQSLQSVQLLKSILSQCRSDVSKVKEDPLVAAVPETISETDELLKKEEPIVVSAVVKKEYVRSDSGPEAMLIDKQIESSEEAMPAESVENAVLKKSLSVTTLIAPEESLPSHEKSVKIEAQSGKSKAVTPYVSSTLVRNESLENEVDDVHESEDKTPNGTIGDKISKFERELNGVVGRVVKTREDTNDADDERNTRGGYVSISLGTWGERPKRQVSIKSDGDYVFGGAVKESAQEKRKWPPPQSQSTVERISPVVPKADGDSEPKASRISPEKKTIPVNSVYKSLDTGNTKPLKQILEQSRLPVVRSVELKAPYRLQPEKTTWNNNTNGNVGGVDRLATLFEPKTMLRNNVRCISGDDTKRYSLQSLDSDDYPPFGANRRSWHDSVKEMAINNNNNLPSSDPIVPRGKYTSVVGIGGSNSNDNTTSIVRVRVEPAKIPSPAADPRADLLQAIRMFPGVQTLKKAST